MGSECIADHTVIWQLKMFWALRLGKSMRDVMSSGSIKLHRKGTAAQLLSVLENYSEFLEQMEVKSALPQKQNEILYLIYCKSVRKLRK